MLLIEVPGMVVPADVMVSYVHFFLSKSMHNFRYSNALVRLKAMSATGFWNQLKKFGHAVYVARYLIPFLYYCRAAITEPRVFGFLEELKKNEAREVPIGTAGFCWGAPFVTKSCWDQVRNRLDDGKRITVCGYVAHPSSLTYPDDIEKVVLPYSVAASEHDPQMSPDQAKQTEEVLTKKTDRQKAEGIEHEFVMYHGAHHGFAVRADENDKEEAERGKKAEEQAVKWFGRWFTNPPA